MPRIEFSKRVKGEIVLRSRNEAGQICCEQCNLVLGFKPFEIDHVIADGLRDKSIKKKLTADDGQLLCQNCHTPKTKDDVKRIAKAVRQQSRNNGIRRPKGAIPNRGFDGQARQPRVKKPTLPPRQLFVAKEVQS